MLLVGAEPVLAQLDEVVVTAQRREQSLNDVPIAVTVLDSGRLERQQIDELKDVVELAPNVGYSNDGSLFNTDVAVRGVSNIGGVSNVVGFYVDEFNVSPIQENATYDQRLLDIERIEVLRGPQGTLFGRNVSGGAISITTKKPGAQSEGYIGAEYGRFDSWQLRGSANLPVSDSFFVRINGFYEQSDGFLDNEGPSDATNDHETYGARVATRFEPSDALTWDFSVSYFDHAQGFYDSVPTGVQNDTFRNVGLPLFPVQAGTWPDNDDTIQTDTGLDIEGDTTMLINRLEYSADAFSVVSVTGFIDHRNTTFGEADHTGLSLYTDDQFEELESWSTEVRIESNASDGFNWLVGAIIAEDESTDFHARPFQEDWFRVILGFTGESGVDFPADNTVLVINDLSEVAVDSIGVFGEIGWSMLEDRLSISAGLRWSRDEVSQTDQRDRFNPFPPFNSVADAEAGGADFDDLLPRLTANFALSDAANLYGTVSKGGKPGGFNLGAVGVPGAPATFEEEQLWNYELGVKGTWFENSLRLNVAVFYLDWEDIQVSGLFFDPVTFETAVLTQNGPAADSTGIEADFAWLPTERLLIEGAVGYNDSEMKRFPDAIIDSSGNTADVTGNRLPGSPEWSGNLAAQYTHPLSVAGLELFGRLEYVYSGDIFRDVENRRLAEDYVPQYDFANLRAGVRGDRYSVTASIENLFDQEYTTGVLGEESFTGVLATVNPRVWSLRLRYAFGD